jgi:hypothetical protein
MSLDLSSLMEFLLGLKDLIVLILSILAFSEAS